jgi:selenocysteine lyase/cysteine desulfurase
MGAERGAVVTFNVLDPRGRIVPAATVQAAACAARVSVRDGCFCNPGAAEAVGLGADAPVPGAVRASLGAANDARDIERLVDVVAAVARAASASRGTGRAALSPSSRPVRRSWPAA